MSPKLAQISALGITSCSLSFPIFRGHLPDASPPSPLRSLVPTWDSRILQHRPPIFHGLKFEQLLYCGSQHGFSAQDFHRHCDHQGPTLVLVRSLSGGLFGGFTPLDWDSKSGTKTDESLSSFLFTIRNPHDTEPRKFPLIPAQKDHAILCLPNYGPCFGGHRGFAADLCLRDACNRAGVGRGAHSSEFGSTYANNTMFPGRTFLTGACEFVVAEIEVFAVFCD
jgi:hypothetical protein